MNFHCGQNPFKETLSEMNILFGILGNPGAVGGGGKERERGKNSPWGHTLTERVPEKVNGIK